MGYEGHMFYHRPQCDYPGCGKPLDTGGGRNAEWFYDLAAMADAVSGGGNDFIVLKGADGEEIGMVRTGSHVCGSLVLYGDDGNPRFFCVDHLLMRDGRPVGFDPSDGGCRPQSDELAARYADQNQPLPKPECERTILDVLNTPVRQAKTGAGDVYGMIPVWELTELRRRLEKCETIFTEESEACGDADRPQGEHMAGCAQMARSTIEYLNGILQRRGE